MKIGLILQARMNSRRLPGKILKRIGEKPLLVHIVDRLSFLRHSIQFVLATSDLRGDDVVASFCGSYCLECFRGDEQDVLDRYYLCARKYGFQHVIRLTGDNPFVDVEELDRLIDFHLDMEADYSHSFDALPVGVGSEIFTFDALERSYFHGTKPHHREHANEYMLENPSLFSTVHLQVPLPKNRPDVRLTVDTVEDYIKACFIMENCKNRIVSTEEAINLCLRFMSGERSKT